MKQVVVIPLGSNSHDNSYSHSMGHQTLRSLEMPKYLGANNASDIAGQILSPSSDSNGNLMSSPSLPAASPRTPTGGASTDHNATTTEEKNDQNDAGAIISVSEIGK